MYFFQTIEDKTLLENSVKNRTCFVDLNTISGFKFVYIHVFKTSRRSRHFLQHIYKTNFLQFSREMPFVRPELQVSMALCD